MQGGLWNTTLRGLHVLGLADTRGRTPIPLLVLNAIHPLVPEELIEFMRGKQRVFVVEEGMPNYIERELKALAHEARLGVEIQGKALLSPHGEYVPHLDIGCSTFSTQAPFNVGNSVLGYGMGLASSSAVSPLFGKRTISVMGDGGFWHNGLTNGVANAMYNRQDSVLVNLDNFYAAATGQHHVPSTGR